MHDIAFVDLADARAAGDRRDDGGIAERCLRAFDRRLVGLHQRRVLRDQCLLRVGLLAVDGVGGGELFVAVEIDLRVGELRFVLRLLRLRLIELRLIGSGIDAGQHVTLLDVVAFLEIDAEQLAVDLRADGDGIERLDGADGVEIDRHVRLGRRSDQHRHRSAFGAEPAAGYLWRRLGEDVDQRRGDRDEDQHDRHVAAGAALGLGPDLLRQFTVHRRYPPVLAASRRRALDRARRSPAAAPAAPGPVRPRPGTASARPAAA